MPIARISGTVQGADDPNRSIRALLLYHLFAGGWDIYNSNGDQRITLCNIEKKIIESDAFVFTPGATLEDLFKAVSIFVGYQTLDKNLKGKATVILNSDGSWDSFFRVLDHLHELGTIKQDHREFLLVARASEQVLPILERVHESGLPDAGRHHPKHDHPTRDASYEEPVPTDILGNVCVFCSASISDPEYLADGYEMGRQLALNGYGCVSGAGKSGIMGEVVRGAAEAGGWSGGSNVPHIIELEGLPDGLSSFWLRPDIYTRMEVMIENSDGFVIFPGGSGTMQELLALLIFQQQGNPVMEGKPVVLFNRLDAGGKRFWDPLIELLRQLAPAARFRVVDELDGILAELALGIHGRKEAVLACC
ncbi:MAG: LOG family protein [Verrucomicrobiales bacterium]